MIPETIDAIRTRTSAETEGVRSTAKTEAALGVRKGFMAPIRASPMQGTLDLIEACEAEATSRE